MYQKAPYLRKYLIISIYIDFIRFCFPLFYIHWLMGYIWASPVSHPTTTEYRSKPRSALPDLPSLCRSSLAAIRAVLCLAVASCTVLAGCHVAAVYDMPIYGCVRHEHIGRRIMAVAVMHIG